MRGNKAARLRGGAEQKHSKVTSYGLYLVWASRHIPSNIPNWYID